MVSKSNLPNETGLMTSQLFFLLFSKKNLKNDFSLPTTSPPSLLLSFFLFGSVSLQSVFKITISQKYLFLSLY